MVRKIAAALIALIVAAVLLLSPSKPATADIEPCQPFPECIPGRVNWLPQVSKP